MKIGMLSSAHVHAASYAERLKQIDGVDFAGVWDDDQARGEAFASRFGTRFFPAPEAPTKTAAQRSTSMPTECNSSPSRAKSKSARRIRTTASKGKRSGGENTWAKRRSAETRASKPSPEIARPPSAPRVTVGKGIC